MYRIMIVEDEEEVREAIKQRIDWKRLGYELVGDYSNGRDALEALSEVRPAVVITDICMPFMDGLQLTEYMSKHYRETRVVIVTGYEDFDYAHQAIKLGVKDYVLKPFNAEEFLDFLTRLKRELDDEKRQKEDLTRIRQQLNESMPLLRERFLERMVTMPLEPRLIKEKLDYFNLSLQGPHFIVVLADLDDHSHPDMVLMRFATCNIFQEVVEREQAGIVFMTRDDKITAILQGWGRRLELLAQTLAEQVMQSVHDYLKLSVSVGIGWICESITSISGSYEGARAALDYRLLAGQQRAISIQDLEYGNVSDEHSYNEWERKLLRAIRSAEREHVFRTIEGWLASMRECGLSVMRGQAAIYKMIAALINLAADTGIDEDKVFGEDPFSPISRFKTVHEVQAWLEKLCSAVVHELSQKRSDVMLCQMQEAEAYIREHYSQENLSLSDVCSHIHMSISYFSAQFKQHTGKTFVEYLTDVRLERAKELLSFHDMKTYEIAESVGYSDPQYFSVIFKRHVGVSPKQYRASRKEQRQA